MLVLADHSSEKNIHITFWVHDVSDIEWEASIITARVRSTTGR